MALTRCSEMVLRMLMNILSRTVTHIIRTMNTEHAQLVREPYTYRFSCSWLLARLQSDALSTFVIGSAKQF